MFQKIPRSTVMVAVFDRMPLEKRNSLLARAEDFLGKL
jgi:hypothetical protein